MSGIAARKENGIASLAYDPGIHHFPLKDGFPLQVRQMTASSLIVPSHSTDAPTGGPPGGRCRKVIVANAPSQEPTAAKAT